MKGIRFYHQLYQCKLVGLVDDGLLFLQIQAEKDAREATLRVIEEESE